MAYFPNNPNGQATMTNSSPVAIASDQSAVPIGGNVASDAVDSGNPSKIGGKARTSNITAVANDDRVDAIFNKLGYQVSISSLREARGEQTTVITASTSETTIVTAEASVQRDLYGIIITNTSTTTGTEITFRRTTGGSAVFYHYIPAGQSGGFMLPADSGLTGSTNTNWTAQCATSTSSIKITALFNRNT